MRDLTETLRLKKNLIKSFGSHVKFDFIITGFYLIKISFETTGE